MYFLVVVRGIYCKLFKVVDTCCRFDPDRDIRISSNCLESWRKCCFIMVDGAYYHILKIKDVTDYDIERGID